MTANSTWSLIAAMQSNACSFYTRNSLATCSVAYVSRGELEGVVTDVLGDEYAGLWFRNDFASSHLTLTFSRNIFRQL